MVPPSPMLPGSAFSYLAAQLNLCVPLSSSQLCGVSYVSCKDGEELSFNI